MISVQEVVVDPDMIAPHAYTILRSTGQFVLGGFQSVTTAIPMFGPVQRAVNKEIEMLPEADRVGGVLAFWSTIPVYTTRGYASVPSTHGEVPQGSGLVYTLSAAPPPNSEALYSAGLLLQQNVDYNIAGDTVTFTSTPAQPLYITWPIVADVATSASDILQYGQAQHRVLQVYRDFGSGYWKALATDMAAA